MTPLVLGLDIGGANLKAATVDKQAVSVPFPLWKQPDKLSAALVDIVAHFPDVNEFAVTMTGELCDCYETKRDGVQHILTAMQQASRCHPIRVWSTEGKFVTVEEARRDYLKVAAANWHGLATYVGCYIPRGTALLFDIGTTTTDIIPILDGSPWTKGNTDTTRMEHGELVYTGVRRTPICAVVKTKKVAAELFATTLDAYLLLGHTLEDLDDTDTADGRPATKANAHARLSRMLCGDPKITKAATTQHLAEAVLQAQMELIQHYFIQQFNRIKSLQHESLGTDRVIITSGSGEFLAHQVLQSFHLNTTDLISLTDRLGPELATCAPAYALAVLATEQRN